MNRIEKIQEEEYYTLDGRDYKLATDDIKYLISKLKLSEMTLEYVTYQCHNATNIRNAAEKALKEIRE